MGIEGKILAILDAQPGDWFCARCLATAASLSLPSDRQVVSQLFREAGKEHTLDDRYEVADETCSRCGTNGVVKLVIRRKPKTVA